VSAFEKPHRGSIQRASLASVRLGPASAPRQRGWWKRHRARPSLLSSIGMACGPCFNAEVRSSRQRCVRPTSATEHYRDVHPSFFVLPVACRPIEVALVRARAPHVSRRAVVTGAWRASRRPTRFGALTFAFRGGLFGRARGRSWISSDALVIEPFAKRRVTTGVAASETRRDSTK